jgi:histidinol-phosphatase (PHP family)
MGRLFTNSAAIRYAGAPMRICTNYHTHTRYCDGVAEPEDYARAALARGFTHLGFSSHAPVPFPNDWTMQPENLPAYLQAVSAVRERYRGRLEVLLGLEVDYLPGRLGPRSPAIQSLGLEFTIGSVHYITEPPRADGFRWTVDASPAEFAQGLAEEFGGDVRRLVERYYQRVGELAERSRPDIIGHFDVVKKNNRGDRYFSEQEGWYRQAVGEALRRIAGSGAALEINTGGIVRNTSGALYPSRWILAECLKLDIPIMVNADAHRPEHIDGYFPEAYALLRDIGYQAAVMLTREGMRELPLA